MSSYSDYVLAERPWAYWPLNDHSAGLVGENQYLIDVSGNSRHLSASPNIVFQSIISQNGSFPSDSIPIRGIKVNGSTANQGFGFLGENTSLYLSTGLDAHVNDVYPENTFISHQLFRKKIKAEFLIDGNILAAQQVGSCSIGRYPIFNIGGMSLWMNTTYYTPCDSCPCVQGASFLTMNYQTLDYCYSISTRWVCWRFLQSIHLLDIWILSCVRWATCKHCKKYIIICFRSKWNRSFN